MKVSFRRGRMASLGMVLALVVTSHVVGGAVTAQAAADRVDFNPELIIDDSQFYDSRAMSKSQIADFFQQKIGTCDNGLCMNVVRTSTESRAADSVCKGYVGAPSESVADIIFKTQESCGISAKVLLVLLQKEQSLVTAKSPSLSRLDRAMGYGCPDDPNRQGWCDPSYGGLYNQIFRSAWQFKRYSNPPGSGSPFTRYPVGRPTQVQFHPNLGCGSSSLTIRNAATAALYYYTPYQPNESALANLYGTGDACATYGNRNFWRMYTDWFGSTSLVSHDPFGNWEISDLGPESVRLQGWTIDPDISTSIAVHLYINDQWGGSFNSNIARADVGKLYPRAGVEHGFDISFPLSPATKPFEACLYAINVGQGKNTSLGCQTLTPPTGKPMGNLETIGVRDGVLRGSGWALDPDRVSPVDIEIRIDGKAISTVPAGQVRPDIGKVFPAYGAKHGFTFETEAPVGTFEACVNLLDRETGTVAPLGCRTLSQASGPPIGSLDFLGLVRPGLGGVSGWALDPDTPGPIDVHYYVNGAWGGALAASAQRPDVGRAYPGYGDHHGYTKEIPLAGGDNEICLYAINTGAGYNSLLGCRTIVSPSGSPIGNFESVTTGYNSAQINGWAIDPDVIAPTELHLYVDGQWGGVFRADAERLDVGRAFPGYGDSHGFVHTIYLSKNMHSVCAYAINVGRGHNSYLGCKSINVSEGS